MSKFIPGNQKHLTLEDRIYIENSLNKGCTFKDIAKYLCKDPTTISKEVKAHRLSDWYHKGTFTMQRTSVSIGITVKRPMLVGSSSSAVSNALPVPPVTRPAPILSGNAAPDLIKPLTSVMAVTRRSATVPSHTNINMMPGLQTENTVRNSAVPVPEST